jgi:Tfp pilus assembly protein FimT
MSRYRQCGLSLVEGLVCLSLSSVLMAVAVPASGKLMLEQRQQGHAHQFAADFQRARMHALGNGAAVHVQFHRLAHGSGYTLHQGPRDACALTDDGQAHCDDDAHLLAAEWLEARRGVALEANVARMTLNPGTMTVTPTGSVRVVNADGQGHRMTVSITGRIRSEKLP